MKSIIIEAGHIYSNRQPSIEQQIGTLLASLFGRILASTLEVKYALLIDDYSPRFQDGYFFSLDLIPFLRDIKPLYDLNRIDFESRMALQAQTILEGLDQKGLSDRIDDKIFLSFGKRKILIKEGDKFSCSLLDSCYYIDKLAAFDFALTILPKDTVHNYRPQQKNTRRILHQLGVDTERIFNIYFTARANEDRLRDLAISSSINHSKYAFYLMHPQKYFNELKQRVKQDFGLEFLV